jgi:hypothetical protein
MSRSNGYLFEKSPDDHRTPLAQAICSNNVDEVSLLLREGAVKSIFVNGPYANSLVCTLPHTVQPPSQYILQPKRVEKDQIHPKILEDIDENLSEYILNLKQAELSKISPSGVSGTSPANGTDNMAKDVLSDPSASKKTKKSNSMFDTFRRGDKVRLNHLVRVSFFFFF